MHEGIQIWVSTMETNDIVIIQDSYFLLSHLISSPLTGIKLAIKRHKVVQNSREARESIKEH